MNISWNGFGNVVVTAKVGQDDVTTVFDPFHMQDGVKGPRTLPASLVVQSCESKEKDAAEAVTSEHEGVAPFVIVHAGEYEVRGIFVTGISAPKKDGTPHTVYRLDGEGMHVAFLGALDRPLSSRELEDLGAIDVLILPVGGGDVLDAKGAVEVVGQVEPRLVIPVYAKAGETDNHADVSAFLRELGAPVEEAVAKVKITKSSLPEEDMRVCPVTMG